MAVRETLDLSLDQALRQVSNLESSIDDLRKPVVVPIDFGDATADLRTIDDRLTEIEEGARQVNRELSELELTAGRSVADFSRLASELRISEDEARQLASSILEAQSAARRVADASGEVARQLDLSEDEARKFTAEMGRAATQTAQVDDAATRAAGGMDRLTGSVDRTRAGFGRLVATAVAFVGIREIARFANASIQAFSNLEESTSKANVVFGDFADTVFDFTANAPTQLGSTRAAAIEMAASFGNLFLSVGLGKDAAADMSTVLVQLGTDLASFNNLTVDESLEKIRSGLVGQSEPLRSVGVLLSEAAVAAKGLELGLGGATGKLSEAEKVQARYAIILEQTVTAQGDFARTADGIANSGRTAAAVFGELQTRIGEGLAPAFSALVKLAPDIAAGFEAAIPSIAAFGLALAEAFTPKPGQADLLDFLNFLSDLPRGFGQVTDLVEGQTRAFGGFALTLDALARGDFEGIKSGLAGIGDAVGDLRDSTAERTGVQSLVDDLRQGTEPALAFGNALAFIGRRGTIDPRIVRNLQAIAGVDMSQTRLELGRLISEGERLGLAAGEIQVLRNALTDLENQMRGSTGAIADYAFIVDTLAGTATTSSEAIVSQVDILRNLRTAAAEAGVSILELVTNASEFPDLAGLFTQLEPATTGLAIASDNLATFAETFETTNTRISNAIDAFGKLPDKLDVTKKQFLANLTVSAAEEAEFQAGLVDLFNIAPALATRLQTEGPAARQLVEDFLKDATGAQRAEAIITGNAQDITGVFTDALGTSIASAGLDTVGVEALRQFLEGFGNTLIAQEGVSALEAELQRLIAQMRFPINSAQFAFAGLGMGPGGGPAGTLTTFGYAPVTVNNTVNYPAVGDVPTAVAQMNQSTAAVATSLNRIGGQ